MARPKGDFGKLYALGIRRSSVASLLAFFRSHPAMTDDAKCLMIKDYVNRVGVRNKSGSKRRLTTI